jgi:hypothetical protein
MWLSCMFISVVMAAVFPSKAVRSFASNTFCHMHAVRIPQQRPATTQIFFKETVPED